MSETKQEVLRIFQEWLVVLKQRNERLEAENAALEESNRRAKNQTRRVKVAKV